MLGPLRVSEPAPSAVVVVALVLLSWPSVSVRPFRFNVALLLRVTEEESAIWLFALSCTVPALTVRLPATAVVPAALLRTSVPPVTVVAPV